VAGATFIADTFNYRIRKVQGGTIATVVGNSVRGYSGDGGPATQAQIGRVYGLACGAGNPIALYIADSDNGVIRALDVNGNISTLWIGLSFPTGIATIDPSTILVADAATNVVWYLSQSYGSCVVAGTRAASYNCHTGSAINTKLSDPRGLAWDGMSLYIADAGNNKIRMVDAAGNISTIAGNGIGGFAGDGFPAVNAQLNHPTSVVFNGTLYVADANNYRVRKFTVGGTITTIAGNGTPSLFGDGGAATSAQVGNPYAVAVDAAGNEYVADNQNDVIRKIDVNGLITTVAGNGTNGYSGDQGPATSAQLNDPRGVAVDANGNIYISDTGNQRIRRVDFVTGKIATIAGTGTRGYSGEGLATSAKIDSPRGLAIDASGNVYIADTGNNRVRKVTGTTISTFAGTGIAGFSGDGGLAGAAQLSGPRGLAIKSNGEVVISDTGNNRVRQVAPSGIITTVAGTGVGGPAGDGGPATTAQLNFPFGLAVDGSGNLFIADTSNHKIRVVGTGGTISTVVAFCGAGFAGDGGVATLAHLNTPYGVAVDSLGNVLIADAANNRIRGARGVLGLIGSRAATCQSPDSTAQPRGSANASGQSTSPPRLADQGGRLRIAAAPPAATSPVVRPSLAALGNTSQQDAGAGNAISPIASQANAAPARKQAPVARDQSAAPAPRVEIPVPRQQPAARVKSVTPGEAALDPLLSLVLVVGALLIVLPRGRNHRERRLKTLN
jgi:sugar lactone lactonase YvrE